MEAKVSAAKDGSEAKEVIPMHSDNHKYRQITIVDAAERWENIQEQIAPMQESNAIYAEVGHTSLQVAVRWARADRMQWNANLVGHNRDSATKTRAKAKMAKLEKREKAKQQEHRQEQSKRRRRSPGNAPIASPTAPDYQPRPAPTRNAANPGRN